MNRLAAALVIVLVGSARADDGHGFMHRLAAEVRARLGDAAAARRPALVPPVPVAVHWKAQRSGALDLGAPLVAMVGADLDGDGKGELYAVTAREVIAIGFAAGRPKELGRVAFAGDPAVPAPRDVVGAAIVDGNAVIATVSSWARGLRVTWRGGQLVADPGEPGFALCAGEQAQLEPGKNFFGSGASVIYAARCRRDLVDAQGHPLHVRAELAVTGKLDVSVETCAAGGAPCEPAVHHAYADVGVAFELADVDRDGTPEVIYAGAGAPGDPDTVRVVALGADAKQARLRKTFTAGGVAGLAVVDVDGDRVQDVFAAVRLVGSTRVDLWRLD